MHRIDAAYCYGRCTFRDGSVGLCVSVSVCTPMNSATTDKPTCRSGADSKETIRKEVAPMCILIGRCDLVSNYFEQVFQLDAGERFSEYASVGSRMRDKLLGRRT